MSNNNREEKKLRRTIIKLIEEEKPENTEQLIAIVRRERQLPNRQIMNEIIQLENEGRIIFKQHPQPAPRNVSTYIKTKNALWFWTTITLSIATTLVVFMIPENSYPAVYLRYVLGSIFVLWFPGYTLVKALFPTREIDSIERIALSIGLSLAVVPIVGLLLNYTQWGIRLTPINLALLGLTSLFATIAVLREFQAKCMKGDNKQKPRVM